MSYGKIFLIIIIIVMLFLIIRNHLCLYGTTNAHTRENFALFNNPNKELNSMEKTTGTGISGVKTNLALCQYCIKSSYNTAYTGTYMNLDAIKYVLSRGCRFVDFQVFLIDNKPYVGYTSDPTFKNITSQNNILLSDVLKQVSYYGFSAPTPNMNDPLFIQLRIQPNYMDKDITDTTAIYQLIAQSIESNLKNRLYSGNVTKDTLIGDLMGKIVLIIDKTTAPDYKKPANCSTSDNCNDLEKYVNMESGGDNIRNNTYSDLLDQLALSPYVHDDGINTQIYMLRLAKPEQVNNTGNPAYFEFISKYGVQFLAERFYINDLNLALYEQFFSDNGFAFVPFSTALPYINKTNV
jgi:hypothetical protein